MGGRLSAGGLKRVSSVLGVVDRAVGGGAKKKTMKPLSSFSIAVVVVALLAHVVRLPRFQRFDDDAPDEHGPVCVQAQQERQKPDEERPVGVGVDLVLHRDQGRGRERGRPNDDGGTVDEAGHDPGAGERDEERGRRVS